jgi:hypothetical protein
MASAATNTFAFANFERVVVISISSSCRLGGVTVVAGDLLDEEMVTDVRALARAYSTICLDNTRNSEVK